MRVIDLYGYTINSEENAVTKNKVHSVYIACELGVPLEMYLASQQADRLFNYHKIIPYLMKMADIGVLLENKRIALCDFTPESFVVIPETGEFKLTDFGYLKKARVVEDLSTKSLEKIASSQ